MAFTLAASAEMLFTDLSFEDRVREIHSRGFEVEIWNWTTKDIDALVATGATFSSMTGYIEGDLLTPDGVNRLHRNCPAVPGCCRPAQLPETQYSRHRAGLSRAAHHPLEPQRGRLAPRGRHPGNTSGARRKGGTHLHPGKPQPAGGPPRHPLRYVRRDLAACSSGR